MTETPPDWAILPNAEYRNIPGEFKGGRGGQIDWKQIRLQGELFIQTFIGRVAIAFGGINIFGWKPLEFLAEWGQKRIDDALANYEAATNAQLSANYANKQLTVLTGGSLATSVTGGVAVNDQFNGTSASTLGSAWTRTSDGSGSGTFGPNGAGRAVWGKSGGLRRRHLDRFNTPLATDYQAVFVVLGKPAEKTPLLTTANGYTWLIARCNTGGTSGTDYTFVWCRIGQNSLAVGKTVAGDWKDPWQSATVTVNSGDQIAFIVGTDTNARQLIIRQNGIVRIDHTDTSSSDYGTGYLYVGVASQAGGAIPQTAPAELDLWAAADRQPTTI